MYERERERDKGEESVRRVYYKHGLSQIGSEGGRENVCVRERREKICVERENVCERGDYRVSTYFQERHFEDSVFGLEVRNTDLHLKTEQERKRREEGRRKRRKRSRGRRRRKVSVQKQKREEVRACVRSRWLYHFR